MLFFGDKIPQAQRKRYGLTCGTHWSGKTKSIRIVRVFFVLRFIYDVTYNSVLFLRQKLLEEPTNSTSRRAYEFNAK